MSHKANDIYNDHLIDLIDYQGRHDKKTEAKYKDMDHSVYMIEPQKLKMDRRPKYFDKETWD